MFEHFEQVFEQLPNNDKQEGGGHTGPGNIPIYVVSGFFDFGGFVSTGFLGMKRPHMYSDLGLFVLYTHTFGYNIKTRALGIISVVWQPGSHHLSTCCDTTLQSACYVCTADTTSQRVHTM